MSTSYVISCLQSPYSRFARRWEGRALPAPNHAGSRDHDPAKGLLLVLGVLVLLPHLTLLVALGLSAELGQLAAREAKHDVSLGCGC